MDEITAFVLYFLAFALIHSVLATDNAKERAEKILKRNFRFYRIIYNIISFITAVPTFYVWWISSSSTPVVYSFPEWSNPFLTLFKLLAIGLFGYALFQNDLLEFAGLKKKKIDSKPITDGVYRIVRHPQYTALIILLFSQNKMTVLDLTAALLVSFYCIIGAFIEEKRLVSSYGDRYRKYQEQVSMFIPVKWIIKRI
ncbi:MAG: isoprenylcysteine carboxylmethyltransferase family protein [Methanosarcinales archaeon]|nr:MAG: isoprenylcysteine carboxylmethyltransferase family protein [Methanosarcinales archaeon]